MHYLELIKLRSGHKILYTLLQIFVSPDAEKITQFWDQVKMRLTSQLIKIISRGLQKLLKYFNDTSILKSFVLQAARVFPVILILSLCNSEFICYHLGHLCDISTKFLMSLNNYCYILINYKLASQHLDFCSIYLSVVYFAYTVSEWCAIF